MLAADTGDADTDDADTGDADTGDADTGDADTGDADLRDTAPSATTAASAALSTSPWLLCLDGRLEPWPDRGSPPPAPCPTSGAARNPSIGGSLSRDIDLGTTVPSSTLIRASFTAPSSRSRWISSRLRSPTWLGLMRPLDADPAAAGPSTPARARSALISLRSSLISLMSAVFSCMMRRLSVRCSSESLASLRFRLSTVFSRYSRWRAASLGGAVAVAVAGGAEGQESGCAAAAAEVLCGKVEVCSSGTSRSRARVREGQG